MLLDHAFQRFDRRRSSHPGCGQSNLTMWAVAGHSAVSKAVVVRKFGRLDLVRWI
jgi:hypothetical protein